MLDPNTNTRREYTDGMMQSFQVPDDAAQDWKHYGENLKELSGKLAFHDAMKPNIDQGTYPIQPASSLSERDSRLTLPAYMTPAASKNKVYFMWDFVSRTLVRYAVSKLASKEALR